LSKAAQLRSSQLQEISQKAYNSGDYHSSELADMQSRMASKSSKNDAQLAFFFQMYYMAMARIAKYTSFERTRLQKLVRDRKELLEIYKMQMCSGEYYMKIQGLGEDFLHVYSTAIVHLPTGKIVKVLKYITLEEIVMNILDNEVYYEDYRIVPELEKNEDKSSKEVAHGKYFVAETLDKVNK
jgi:hypothetical protein